MSDLIDRQAAIDKINERQRKLIDCFGFENDLIKIMDIAKSIIIAMPSAQVEIIRCGDCRWNDGTCYCEFHYRDVKADDYCVWAERRTDGTR